MLENPSDGSELAPHRARRRRDIDAAVQRRARRAAPATGGGSPPPSAGACWRASARRSRRRPTSWRRLEALDVGKPLKQAPRRRAGAGPLLRVLRRRLRQGARRDLPYPAGYTVLTLREPHGVTGHIVPWNYPMQIVGRSVGAALAMGNACVLKPAEEACLTVLAFARIAQRGRAAGRARSTSCTGLGEEAGAALAAHPGIDHVSFTGSVATGALVQAAAAKNAVPVTLELGGKSPQIVFADADLDARAAVPRQRRHPERRADLLGGVAHPGRAPGVRRAGAGAHGRALPRRCASARRRATSTSAR